MIVTSQFLFTLCAGEMVIFNTQSTEVHKRLSIDYDGMMHPITYLNKFVLWRGNQLVLHNVMEDTKIHTFKPLQANVITVVQTPVINIVACGL